jgi:mono/diheme cytochrome c family protein
MKNNVLYGISGIFNTPDEIMGASKATVKEGYKKFDTHTPYPVHGLEKAMNLKRSPLGYFAFFLGTTGLVVALLFMYWTMVVDYPMNIGGKPQFPLPAFIPVTFEVTVLLASVGTVSGMIVLLFKFPNNRHPLHDTEYMTKVSSDKYGLIIEADDEKFDEESARAFLEKLGAVDIQNIYYDEEEFSYKHKVLDPKFVGGLAMIAIVTSGATYFVLNKLLWMEPFTWMQYQPRYSAMAPTDFFDDGFSMRVPVEGTVARGFKPYAYAKMPDSAAKYMVNPLQPTERNLNVGERKYNIYCSPCHDYQGSGQARLNGQFPNPPSLHSAKVRDWEDGSIYHVITDGQNTMPSYASQLSVEERWQVVLYVRALQRALNAKEEDLQ